MGQAFYCRPLITSIVLSACSWVAFPPRRFQCLRKQRLRQRLRLQGAALHGAALFCLVSGGQAVASTGCTAVNAGTWNVTAVKPSASPLSQSDTFAVGDRLRFTISTSDSLSAHYTFSEALSAGATGPDGPVTQLDFTVTKAGVGRLLLVSTQDSAPITVTSASCTAVSATNTNTNTSTDSQKLGTVQAIGSRMVGQASGAAITGAIDGAIADGFGGDTGMSPANAGGTETSTFNLGAGSGQMSRLGGFASPSYVGASDRSIASVARRDWKSWASVRGSGWDQDDRNANTGGIRGYQINATFGVGRLLMPGVLVGIVGGYENFSNDVQSENNRLKGDGWTAGGYFGWAFAQSLRFDVAGTWTGLAYDAAAGTAAGSFNANRWLASTGLTGTYRSNALVVEPSARLYTLWERQDAWTDSSGAAQAGRSFSVGRASTGAKLIYSMRVGAGTTLSPFVGLFADYRFSNDDAPPVNQPLLGSSNGWSARAATGVALTFNGGTRLSIDGELGGIGSGDPSIWTASGRGSIPF